MSVMRDIHAEKQVARAQEEKWVLENFYSRTEENARPGTAEVPKIEASLGRADKYIQAEFGGVPAEELPSAISRLITEIEQHRSTLNQLRRTLQEYKKVKVSDVWGRSDKRDPSQLESMVGYFKVAFRTANGCAGAIDHAVVQLKMVMDQIEDARRWGLYQPVTTHIVVPSKPRSNEPSVESNFDPDDR